MMQKRIQLPQSFDQYMLSQIFNPNRINKKNLEAASSCRILINGKETEQNEIAARFASSESPYVVVVGESQLSVDIVCTEIEKNI